MMTFTILFTFPCEKSKTVSFASSLNNWIAVCLHRSRFAGKYWLALLLLDQHQALGVCLSLLLLKLNKFTF